MGHMNMADDYMGLNSMRNMLLNKRKRWEWEKEEKEEKYEIHTNNIGKIEISGKQMKIGKNGIFQFSQQN